MGTKKQPGTALTARARKTPAKRKSTAVERTARTVKLWAPGGPVNKAIAVGEDRYPVNADGSIDVPPSMEKIFRKIGCTSERNHPE